MLTVKEFESMPINNITYFPVRQVARPQWFLKKRVLMTDRRRRRTMDARAMARALLTQLRGVKIPTSSKWRSQGDIWYLRLLTESRGVKMPAISNGGARVSETATHQATLVVEWFNESIWKRYKPQNYIAAVHPYHKS